MQLLKNPDPENLQLQSGLGIDYRKKDLLIDALMLTLYINGRAYSAVNIVPKRMFFYNMLKFPSDMQWLTVLLCCLLVTE